MIKLVQLTDTHLFGSGRKRLAGVDTRKSFLRILERVQASLSKPDALLLTGDLSQDESEASYRWLKKRLDNCSIPFYWLCGNHDRLDRMQNICGEALAKRVNFGVWQVILLNSQQHQSPKGFLADEELALLEEHASAFHCKHTLVALHHPAYRINSRCMDEINLQNSDAFMQLLRKYRNIKAVVNGHVHQEYDLTLDGVRYLASPSTSVQFKPNADDFQLDYAEPGCRELMLYADGTLETTVIRLEGGDFQPSTTDGY